jgi:flagellar assembly factor FliW
MPVIETRHFGKVDYDRDGVFEFPFGLPGFEEHRKFLLFERPNTHPLIFMQSLDEPDLGFIAAPVTVAVGGYSLSLAGEELAALGLVQDVEAAAGSVLYLGLITAAPGAAPTINLASPIVLNAETRKGVQAVRMDGEYSFRHPLLASEEALQCS